MVSQSPSKTPRSTTATTTMAKTARLWMAPPMTPPSKLTPRLRQTRWRSARGAPTKTCPLPTSHNLLSLPLLPFPRQIWLMTGSRHLPSCVATRSTRKTTSVSMARNAHGSQSPEHSSPSYFSVLLALAAGIGTPNAMTPSKQLQPLQISLRQPSMRTQNQPRPSRQRHLQQRPHSHLNPHPRCRHSGQKQHRS